MVVMFDNDMVIMLLLSDLFHDYEQYLKKTMLNLSHGIKMKIYNNYGILKKMKLMKILFFMQNGNV
jgi:hypothetical protein